MVVEHLVSVGRRTALERTAHFFMELAERLTLVGLATETEFKCPLSQFVIADALGLTAIPTQLAGACGGDSFHRTQQSGRVSPGH